jgi:hypothetical protein
MAGLISPPRGRHQVKTLGRHQGRKKWREKSMNAQLSPSSNWAEMERLPGCKGGQIERKADKIE